MATDNEAPNRATLALVDAKISTVVASVDGLHGLVKSEGEALRGRLDGLAGLPVAVARLESQNQDQERRLADLEAARTRVAGWRVLAAVSFGSAILGLAAPHIVHVP